MLLVGWASSSYMLYAGLVLYSFGTNNFINKHSIKLIWITLALSVIGSGTVVPSMTTMVSKYGKTAVFN